VIEGENGLAGTRAFDRHVRHVKREPVGQVETARREPHDVSGLGVDQRGLNPLLRIGAGCDIDGLGSDGRYQTCGDGGGKQNGASHDFLVTMLEPR
jgi:hypothetical protein